MPTVSFDIDDDLSYDENIAAFTAALKQLDADLADALATEIAADVSDPAAGRDAVLSKLFAALTETSA